MRACGLLLWTTGSCSTGCRYNGVAGAWAVIHVEATLSAITAIMHQITSLLINTTAMHSASAHMEWPQSAAESLNQQTGHLELQTIPELLDDWSDAVSIGLQALSAAVRDATPGLLRGREQMTAPLLQQV
jgi:hypothetical protein